MELVFMLLSVLQSLAASLGFGVSAVLLLQFLKTDIVTKDVVAIRRLLQQVYFAAFIFVLLTTTLLALLFLPFFGTSYLTPFTLILWTYLLALLLVKICIRFDLLPKLVVMGLETATWIALAVTLALPTAPFANTTFLEILVFYFGFIGIVTLTTSFYISRSENK